MLKNKLNSIKTNILLIISVIYLANCNQKSNSNNNHTHIEARRLQTLKHVEKYPDGTVKITGNLVKSMRQGKWEAFYENGVKWSESNYLNGKRNGIYKIFYPNGRLKVHGVYENGEKVDVWFFYLENGKFEKEIDFNIDK